MKFKEAKSIVAKNAYQILYTNLSSFLLDRDDQGSPRSPEDIAMLHLALKDLLEKLKVRSEG